MGPAKEVVPCVFALFLDKGGQTYMKLWMIFKSLVTFKERLPNSVASDFEKGVFNTLGNVFLDISIKGRHFHQKQTLRRNIQAKGFLNS